MVLVNVQWYWRTSGRNPDAENFRLNTSDAPLASDGNTMDMSALPWNTGIEQ